MSRYGDKEFYKWTLSFSTYIPSLDYQVTITFLVIHTLCVAISDTVQTTVHHDDEILVIEKWIFCSAHYFLFITIS